MSEAQTPEPWIRVSFGEKENFVELSIENAGGPIPHHIQDKLFQPFYSTKEVGKGTGLGLSISRGLVENHQGVIFYDRAAQHPRFVIHLPILAAENTLRELKS